MTAVRGTRAVIDMTGMTDIIDMTNIIDMTMKTCPSRHVVKRRLPDRSTARGGAPAAPRTDDARHSPRDPCHDANSAMLSLFG